MSFSKYLVGLSIAAALTACGGGGGSPGATTNSTGTTGNTGTTGTVTTPQIAKASMTMDVLSGAGVSTNSISAIEISKVSIVLKDAAGNPVPGAVVTFAEKGGGLLTVAPVSKTALTDVSGVASVEIRAASGTAVGATTIGASATVAAVAVAAELSIAITSAPTGGLIDPQSLANAMNFLDVNPADKSIVLAGAGGNGRSESATLRFRVVDKNNTPVKGTLVTFAVAPAADVKLNIASATSDADGVVVTTVSSKTVATAVVITATVTRAGGTITSQSDQLLVTTGISTPGGFDLSAGKYNMNSSLTGDATTITVRIVDANGNPVADGVPVVFTAPFGAVGSSSRGGCVTSGGGCTVDYKVQDPRPQDGQLATVTASTQIGDGSSISETLDFRFVDTGLLDLFALDAGTDRKSFDLANCDKTTFTAYLGTPEGFPAPAGTTVALTAITSDFAATLKTGSPILDQLSLAPSRTRVDIEFDVSKILGANACVPGGSRVIKPKAAAEIKFTAGSIVTTGVIEVAYPASPLP